MSKRFKKMLAYICCLIMLSSIVPVSVFANSDDTENSEMHETPTAMFGTPQLGSNDPLWNKTKAYPINKSTVPDDPRPHATGTVKVLWDHNYVYAHVDVVDSDLYQGPGQDHTYDSVEFFVGPGSSGSNQWRVSSTGMFSGQSHPDRAAWTKTTDTGYIVEARIPRRDLNLEPGKLTFEVNINNSTKAGGDRYEVVSAFGDPDTGFNSDAAFTDSLTLIEADEADNRHSITLLTDTGGTITPNAPGSVLRAVYGSDLTFTVTPYAGKIVGDVTLDGDTVTVSDDNTFSLTDIRADHLIQVTFNDDPDANQIPFNVWNDNFARGEYTTAVIIDLGEGREALASELHPELFTVSSLLEGQRKISRVYANDEAKVRGYLGEGSNSPDYQDGLASGRYIVVELEFYTDAGGRTTLDGSSNSTEQNYNIVQEGDIVLTEGDTISNAVFKQENVVNPILDKFTSENSDSVNYALYLHKDEAGEEVEGLPLYVYIHGMTRGGTQAESDQKASMKSANGSVALMKRIEEHPAKYASHIVNISYNGTSTPDTDDVKKVIDDLIARGLVDSNRIYVAGFSWGGAYTNTLINTYPGFFAAGAPMAPVFGSPEASDNEAHKDLAYWIFVNAHNTGIYQTNLDNFINNNMPHMTNARASRFESNEALTWPYNQYDQPSQRPDPEEDPVLQDWIAHEVEAAVLYNEIKMDHPFTEETWSIAPSAQSSNLPDWNNDYTDVFDWMFRQSKLGELPDVPDHPTAMFGTPELGSGDPLWSKTQEYPINKSTAPHDPRPHATGTVKVLWDHDYVYARVAVEDSNLYQGAGADHTYDSIEFFVGPGSSGSNQWRVSATGVFSGQSHTDRAAWTQITDTGYIVEMRIPKRDLTLEPGKLTFEVNINNSSEIGADRYEVVSAFGDPDTGFNSDAAFRDSLTLIEASEVDTRHSITLSVDTGGTITPNKPGNVMRVESGEDVTFTVIPDIGKVVDTVTVDGEAVTLSDDNTFSLTNISADHRIQVTFDDDPDATQLPFIVWNDNFASGEYTTAVIIDLGEGQEALGSALDPDMFTVSARNTTLVDDLVVFAETRKISRVYANNEPKVRGYLGEVRNSPDYEEGLDSGRYIVVEIEFYTDVGGRTTLDGSNSTKQNYNIVQESDIVLTEGDPISYAVFKQEDVVNPILDKFTAHTSDSGVNYALYLHKDEADEEVEGLPLYVYTHGFSRGGTQAHIDQKASMKSANGSVALMKRMEKNPDKYASHILNISYSDGNAPQVGNIKAIIDELVASGLVDANRIYVSGFSMGGGVTTNLINTYPGFFAAAAPLGISSGWPTAEENRDLAYWLFVNTYDSGAANVDNMRNDIDKLNNARASRFDSNEALTWPYNQYDQPSQRPNMENDPPLVRYIAHEVEAAVLHNQITMWNPFTEETWSIAPIIQSPNLPTWNNDYSDVYDWMFRQSKLGELPDIPAAPSNLTATAGDRQVTLNWAAPANDGGSEILGYKVWYGEQTPVTVDASTFKYTFTGLTNGQSYTFKIVAVNEMGNGAEASLSASPRRSSSPGAPIVINPPGSGDDDTNGDTDTDTDAESPIPSYELNTPEDKPAVTDQDGNTTLPGGGEIVIEGGSKIHVPEGTTINSKGKIVVGLGGASLSLDSGVTLNIQEGAELELNDDSALGFIVVSGNPFTDVNNNDWFNSYVNSAYTFGLFDGTSSTTFSPGASMTRAMFVQVLANLENIDRSEYTNSRFSDVEDGQWYTAAVEWAAENGIVNGVSADLFDPHASLTREQMLVILFNYMNYKGYDIPQSQAQSFADESEISAWALEAVQALQGINIVTGKGNNMFDPKGTATRAEVATVFVRFIEFLAR